MALQSINPATGTLIESYAEPTDQELLDAVEQVDQTYQAWRETPWAHRRDHMTEAANLLRRDKDRHARLMANEMGKPLAQGLAEAEKCAWVCEYFAENAERFLADRLISTDATRSFVTFRPLGILLAVMPWNFPYWQVFRCAAPSLMAGNVVMLKHASNVSGCALAIEEIFQEAGFPTGAFRTLLVNSSRLGSLIDHPSIKAVTLTGSVPAGRSIAAKAGAALKKTVLELGGSDPYIVLEDADLEAAATTCVTSRLINSGQSCIAAKRFIVVDAVASAFERIFVEKMRAQKVGDPLAAGTTVGPMARVDLRDELHDQVLRTVKQGARLLLGGEMPEGPGAFYPVTVLADVTPEMPAFQEETFGPVAAIIRARDEADAIHMANDSVFGLGAAVFTGNPQRGERIAAHDLEAGSCFVNSLVKSDPRLPFGGIKESGYGRELADFGIHEFVNIKTVYVK
jgi:succinate-semialdehyde dehydrogenase/glutarate-semialdehyde dehydrogenase